MGQLIFVAAVLGVLTCIERIRFSAGRRTPCVIDCDLWYRDNGGVLVHRATGRIFNLMRRVCDS
jgi:hypothetical protein